MRPTSAPCSRPWPRAGCPINWPLARSIAEARSFLTSRAFEVVLTADSLPDGTASDLTMEFSESGRSFSSPAEATRRLPPERCKRGIENYLTKDRERQYLKLLPYRVESARRQSRRMRQWWRQRGPAGRERSTEEHRGRRFPERFSPFGSNAMARAVSPTPVRPSRKSRACRQATSWPTAHRYSRWCTPTIWTACDDSMAESARTMLPWYHQFRLRRPGNGEIWVEGHATPVGEPGGDITWHGIITDITQRKEEAIAHEKLRRRGAACSEARGGRPARRRRGARFQQPADHHQRAGGIWPAAFARRRSDAARRCFKSTTPGSGPPRSHSNSCRSAATRRRSS